LYGSVVIIKALSRRSMGRPCGLRYSVPLIFVIPLFVAMTTTGA